MPVTAVRRKSCKRHGAIAIAASSLPLILLPRTTGDAPSVEKTNSVDSGATEAISSRADGGSRHASHLPVTRYPSSDVLHRRGVLASARFTSASVNRPTMAQVSSSTWSRVPAFLCTIELADRPNLDYLIWPKS
jgi:hypothetical protein